jgi:hypothetical protein
MDKIFLEDFRIAFQVTKLSQSYVYRLTRWGQHLKDTSGSEFHTAELTLPVAFFDRRLTRVRLPGDAVGGDPVAWQSREDNWTTFWKTRGRETLHRPGKASVNSESMMHC